MNMTLAMVLVAGVIVAGAIYVYRRRKSGRGGSGGGIRDDVRERRR